VANEKILLDVPVINHGQKIEDLKNLTSLKNVEAFVENNGFLIRI
jgi:hypothetical protein